METTAGTTQDCSVTADVHADLARSELLPSVHLADEAYLDAPLLVESQRDYGVELLGPVARDGSWQAVAGEGFDASAFTVDWEAQRVTCPQGKRSQLWLPQKDTWGNEVIHIKFSASDCQVCASREACTRSRSGRRQMALRPKEQYEALHAARRQQTTPAFQERYHRRAGIEGTLSQAVRVGGLRRCRYLGRAKAHLQNVAIASALNLLRMVSWVSGVPLGGTHESAFLRLCRSTRP